MKGLMNMALAGKGRRSALSLVSFVSLLSFPLVLFAQAPVDTTETWSSGDLAGWVHESPQATLSWVTNGYMDLSFGGQTIATYAEDVTRSPVGGVLITNISFRFLAADIFPSAVRLYMHSSKSGNSWYVNLPEPEAGNWVEFNVPMDFSARWILGPVSRQEAFLRDLRSLDWVGVYVRRHGSTAAQHYGIDDFRVQGVRIPDSVSICGVVLYEGEQEGPMRVSAVSVGEEGLSTGATVTVAGPGPYQLSGLPPFLDYEVSAFQDTDGNAVRGFWEANGSWTGNPANVSYTGLTDVNIELTDPKDGAGLPYWWLRRYFNMSGPGDTNALAGGGANLWAAYLAGTDPRDPGARFEIALGTTNEAERAGIVLWWKSVAHRRYTVWRATDLVEGFVRIEEGMPGTPPVNMYRDTTATNAGPYFYRIDVGP